jgi:MHS family citrate/tricarballylate:H+ symporter-like MFS transporter
LIGRLLQGFSAGAEMGGVSVYLAEIATPGRRGFYTSWQSASQQVAIVLAAALGYTINASMEAAEVAAWGWRIPFFIGCVIIPFIFIIRRSLQETDAFKARRITQVPMKCSARCETTGAQCWRVACWPQ